MDRVDEVVLRDRVDVVLELDREHVGRLRLGGRSRHREEERSGDRRERETRPRRRGAFTCRQLTREAVSIPSSRGLGPCPRTFSPAPCSRLSCRAASSSSCCSRSARRPPHGRTARRSLRGTFRCAATARCRRPRRPASRSSDCTGRARARWRSGRGRSAGAGAPGSLRSRRTTARTAASRERRLTRLAARQPVVGRAVRRDPLPGPRRRSAAARVVRLEPGRPVPERQLSIAGSPQLIPRSGWRADERIVRAKPMYADRLSFSVVHHTAGERLLGGRVGRDRPLDPALPREGQRLERHRLQPARRPVRQGLRGSRRRRRPQRRRRSCRGLQHGLGRRGGDRRVQLDDRAEGGRGRARRRPRVAARPRARRPLGTLSHLSGGNPRFPGGLPVFLRPSPAIATRASPLSGERALREARRDRRRGPAHRPAEALRAARDRHRRPRRSLPCQASRRRCRGA